MRWFCADLQRESEDKSTTLRNY